MHRYHRRRRLKIVVESARSNEHEHVLKAKEKRKSSTHWMETTMEDWTNLSREWKTVVSGVEHAASDRSHRSDCRNVQTDLLSQSHETALIRCGRRNRNGQFTINWLLISVKKIKKNGNRTENRQHRYEHVLRAISVKEYQNNTATYIHTPAYAQGLMTDENDVFGFPLKCHAQWISCQPHSVLGDFFPIPSELHMPINTQHRRCVSSQRLFHSGLKIGYAQA